MRNAALKFFAILCLFFIVSCHKDEVAKQQTFSFTTPNSNYYILLSDQSGTILDWKALAPNVTYSYSYAKSDSINVTTINTQGANSGYEITTYTNVAPGDYSTYTSGFYPPPATAGIHTLINSTPADYSSFLLGVDCGYTPNTDNTQYQINVCGTASLYLTLEKGNDVPRYLFLPQIKPLETTTINQTLYNSLPEMKARTISFNESTEGGASGVYGNTSNGNRYGISFYEQGTPSSSQPIYYPDQTGSLFKSFDVSLTYSKQSSSSVVYEFSKRTTDPSTLTFEELPANLEFVTSKTTSLLSYKLNGKAHYAEVLYTIDYSNTTTPLTSNGYWNVYSNFSTDIQIYLPQFPDDLKKEIDLSFLSALSLNQVKLVENNDFGGYHSFYKKNILGYTGLTLNYRDKTYNTKTDGTIGGRFANSPLSKYRSLRHK